MSVAIFSLFLYAERRVFRINVLTYGLLTTIGRPSRYLCLFNIAVYHGFFSRQYTC